jgi:hypothetical protein
VGGIGYADGKLLDQVERCKQCWRGGKAGRYVVAVVKQGKAGSRQKLFGARIKRRKGGN